MTLAAGASYLKRSAGGQMLLLAVNFAALLAITTAIELSGGYPSQLAHLYYVPVVVSALTLNHRMAFAVAVLAALLVTPAIDVFNHLIGSDTYFSDPSPWNFTPSGWILRPLAFLTISLTISTLFREKEARQVEQVRSEAMGGELNTLSQIDKLILAGASEEESLEEICRFVLAFTGAYFAGLVTPEANARRLMTFRGFYSDRTGVQVNEHVPAEGVAGWAMMHGRTSATSDLFSDTRYQDLAEFARTTGWRSAAAAPVVLDAEILGALVIGFTDMHEFTEDELATVERLADQCAVAITNARQRESLRSLALDTATVLSSVIESRDAYTGDHCVRLVEYAGDTAEAIGLISKDVELIKLGAALHDVGKIAVPDHVLKKPDKLTPEEFSIIKQHCYVGGQICKKVPFLASVYPMVYHHHEFYDGGGYPDGLKGESIPLGARIIAVVDAFDAMTSDRPYRRSMGQTYAVRTLREGAGEQWDPEVVERFLDSVAKQSHSRRIAA
ncbi:MAG TPA: HD domain-containing phosphohydrolase [Dehalococcoidia bacterium]|nr:HD domain-containing phosphohydrolase [Dehalococcoidia bacterium]